jgi:general nucleoside transport system ATP-binding protein
MQTVSEPTSEVARPTGTAPGGAGGPALSMRGITKRFPGVVANDGVDFEAAAGEVHALLGENGAGKTTLSHVLTGLYRPDEGEIVLYGQAVRFASPRQAIDAGVCMVHQQFRLVDRFTVAENIVLGDTRGAGRHLIVNAAHVEDRVRELGERYGLPVDPHAHVWQLSVGEQQRVEILKALYQDARILILDEPTAVLTPEEAETLFVTLRRMAGEGRTVIFISHKLHEVLAVSDRVTILRAGRNVETVPTAGATPESLAALMVGHDVETVSRSGEHPGEGEAPVLEVDGAWVESDRGRPAVRGVTFAIRPGEIVAVAGVAGNGQRELSEAICGLRPCARGTISVGGEPLENGDARAAFDAGIGFIPEDRLGTGVAPTLSIAMNLELRNYRKRSFGPFLRPKQMREDALAAIRDYEIKAPGPGAEADTLSGGNLQKLVLAREFSDRVRVLVAASPTRGLDVAAVQAVHSLLLEAARGGAGVLLISEDLDEILALNDRILVMYEGELAEVEPGETVAEIGLRMAGETPGAVTAGRAQPTTHDPNGAP